MTLNIYQSNLIQISSHAAYREGVDCISSSLYESLCDSDEKGAQRSRAGDRAGCPEAVHTLGQQHEAWVGRHNSCSSEAHCSSHPGRSPGQPNRAAGSLGKCRLPSLCSTVQYLGVLASPPCCVRSRIFIPFGLEIPMPHVSRVRQFVSAGTDWE